MEKLHLTKISLAMLSCGMLATIINSSPVNAHGFIESPPSRQQYCGVLTKPHETGNADALYPICKEAFDDFPTGGYSFMSVLTHARGRLRPLPALEAGATAPAPETGGVVPELASNVCGYDAETFNNGATPWDSAIDWPTASISAGRNLFTWNISYGPHFDDTQEFHYWITKADYNFEVGKALTWDDFEVQPFCKLDFDRSDYSANGDIVADTDNAKFHTYCDVPERSGQHVIYAEWGRNYYTWERFHGCVDVQFSESNETPVQANIGVSPSGGLIGSSTLELSASQSSGDNLTYQWSIKQQTTDAIYTFSDPSAENTSLTFTDPTSLGQVSIHLTITSDAQESTQSLTLEHRSEAAITDWDFQQVLTEELALSSGDTVQMRVVLNTGEDVYLPAEPIKLTAETATAIVWPMTLAKAVNEENGPIVIGVLNADTDLVEPIVSATNNNVYSKSTESIASVYLNALTSDPQEPEEPQSDIKCYYEVGSEWNGGFSGKIIIENNGTQDVSGWEVNWSYQDGSSITHSWNANVSGSYSASNVSWNQTVPAGGKVEFGFNGISASSTAEIPEVTGDICASTAPGGTDPVVTDPVVTDPVITDPVITDPVVTDPDETGTVLISEDFEDQTNGAVPAGWGRM